MSFVQEQIEEKVRGIAQKTLNLTELKTIRVYVPPIERQKQFVTFIESTNKSNYAIQQSLNSLEQCRNALMERLSGKT
jgi:type I restriction enzyme S subunit